MGGRRRWLRGVLAAAAVAGAVAGHLALRADLARAEGELAAAEGRLAGALAARTTMDRLVAATRADGAGTRHGTGVESVRVAGVRAEATTLGTEAADTWVAAAATGAAVEDTGIQLASAQEVLTQRGDAIAQLRACLGGVQAAAAESRAGDTVGAVAALQAVVVPCRRARGLDGGGAVHPFDFPDPFVVRDGGTYYAYATNAAGGPVQVLRSSDLTHWEPQAPALSVLPAWAQPGATWAPSVVRIDGRWLLYYTVRERASRRQCISVAEGGGPAGPFTDGTPGPLVCELGEGGSIDPSPFVAADGTAYLLWKTEGDALGGRAQIRSQRLGAGGRSFEGQPAVLIQADQPWEGRTVEGPTMLATGAGFLLLYSANSWNGPDYAIGGALCDSPAGPCRKVGRLLTTSGAAVGPGGPEVFHDGTGAARFAYHAWQPGEVGYPHGRLLHIGTVSMRGTTPALTG